MIFLVDTAFVIQDAAGLGYFYAQIKLQENNEQRFQVTGCYMTLTMSCLFDMDV